MYFDSRHIAVLGGTVAAVAAGLYVLWGPSGSTRKPRLKGRCPGLVNLGNSCFLNALLQALAPCRCVLDWITACEVPHSPAKSLVHTLTHLLKVLNNDSVELNEEHTASDVIDALKAKRWVITSDEQDVHEMFHVLTETLDEEVTRNPAVHPISDISLLMDSDVVQPPDVAVSRGGTCAPMLPQRCWEHPFRGLLASQLQCKSCGHKNAVKYDTFDSLSLSIPTKYIGTLSLDHLLKHYIMSETVQNVECTGCKIVKLHTPVKTTFVKRLTLGKLPRCLSIQIQRTSWLNNGMPLKKYDHINFPEVLNMSEYMYHQRQKFPPTSLPGLEINLGSGLIGGRKPINGISKGCNRKLGATSPTVTVPYSGPVNLLKALNYHSHTSMSGMDLPPPQSSPATTPHPQDSMRVRQLAHTYSTEVLSPVQSNSYKLASVVVHLGDVLSGHFVTYRRAPSVNGQRFPTRWLYTSDTLVKRATPSEVFGANAYMLFYEKI